MASNSHPGIAKNSLSEFPTSTKITTKGEPKLQNHELPDSIKPDKKAAEGTTKPR
jgi:hypothetical protein